MRGLAEEVKLDQSYQFHEVLDTLETSIDWIVVGKPTNC